MSETCVWLINRKRTDPWAEPGSKFLNVCGEPATYDSGCGPLCAKHARCATAPDVRARICSETYKGRPVRVNVPEKE